MYIFHHNFPPLSEAGVMLSFGSDPLPCKSLHPKHALMPALEPVRAMDYSRIHGPVKVQYGTAVDITYFWTPQWPKAFDSL